jgi:hypothetical protein
MSWIVAVVGCSCALVGNLVMARRFLGIADAKTNRKNKKKRVAVGLFDLPAVL